MKRYINIFLKITQQNIIREMEFRGNFLLMLSLQCVWALLQIFLTEIMFQYTDNIIGWTKIEIFALIGFYRIIKGIFDMFLYANIMYLPENVNKGELDYSLTRPINSLFLLSVRRQYPDNLGPLLTGFGILIYALIQSDISFSLFFMISTIVSLMTATLAFYCLMLACSLISFYTQRLTALSSLYDVANNVLRVPMDVYLRNNIVSELILFPLILTATLPVKIMLSKLDPFFILAQLLGSLILFFFTYKFWHKALLRYSSASS